MEFRLVLNLDNAAFDPLAEPDMRDGREIARALRAVANRLDSTFVDAIDRGVIRDMNGNAVGSWEVARVNIAQAGTRKE